jgi:hypothetical protein
MRAQPALVVHTGGFMVAKVSPPHLPCLPGEAWGLSLRSLPVMGLMQVIGAIGEDWG